MRRLLNKLPKTEARLTHICKQDHLHSNNPKSIRHIGFECPFYGLHHMPGAQMFSFLVLNSGWIVEVCHTLTQKQSSRVTSIFFFKWYFPICNGLLIPNTFWRTNYLRVFKCIQVLLRASTLCSIIHFLNKIVHVKPIINLLTMMPQQNTPNQGCN